MSTIPGIWQSLAQVLIHQSMVACGRVSHSCCSPRKFGHYFYKPLVFGRCVFSSQCLARQWMHVLRLFPDAFGRLAHFFYVKVYLDPEADSCPALRCQWRVCAVDASVAFSGVVNSYPEVNSCPALRRVWRVCAVDASVAFLLLSGVNGECAQSMLQLSARAGYTWKSGHYGHEPFVPGSHLIAVWAF